MIIAGTGHRPNKLGGYGKEVTDRLAWIVEQHLRSLPKKPEKIISGLALGFDQALAVSAIRFQIPVIAALPFKSQDIKWPEHAKDKYRQIIGLCDEVVIVSPGWYSARKMQIRNEWMVDRATDILALFSGEPGGTANCIAYANQKERPIVNLWDQWTR